MFEKNGHELGSIWMGGPVAADLRPNNCPPAVCFRYLKLPADKYQWVRPAACCKGCTRVLQVVSVVCQGVSVVLQTKFRLFVFLLQAQRSPNSRGQLFW